MKWAELLQLKWSERSSYNWNEVSGALTTEMKWTELLQLKWSERSSFNWNEVSGARTTEMKWTELLQLRWSERSSYNWNEVKGAETTHHVTGANQIHVTANCVVKHAKELSFSKHKQIWNRLDCQRSEKRSKTQKRLKRTLFNWTKEDLKKRTSSKICTFCPVLSK